MLAIQAPAFLFLVHDDGTIAHLGPWPARVLVSDELLTRADGRRVVVGDGLLSFRCTNGGARYALSASTVPGVLQGRLVESWEHQC